MLRFALKLKIRDNHTEELYGPNLFFPAMVVKRRLDFVGHAIMEHYLHGTLYPFVDLLEFSPHNKRNPGGQKADILAYVLREAACDTFEDLVDAAIDKNKWKARTGAATKAAQAQIKQHILEWRSRNAQVTAVSVSETVLDWQKPVLRRPAERVLAAEGTAE